MRYTIHEGNLDAMRKKVTHIQNKCKKYGCDFVFEETGEEFREEQDEYGNRHITRYIIVEAEGKAIVGGWEYVASLEHTDKGNIIKTAVNDVEIPDRYYHCKPVCEHCKTSRARKSTYIVRSTYTGTYKQVGKSCLCDFTHGLDVSVISAYENLFAELEEAKKFEGGYYKSCIKTEDYLRYAAETVRHFGYTKKSDCERGTSSRALGYYRLKEGFRVSKMDEAKYKAEMDAVGFDAESDAARELVTNALTWLETQEETSNYIHNLKTVCALEYQNTKNLGILASLFPAYDKDLERQAMLEAQTKIGRMSDYVGEVGERIDVNVAKMVLLTSWECQWGIMERYKITDTDGNVYTWKTSESFKFEHSIEKIRTLKGTVKDHTEFRGTKQTELTRCKVTREEKEEPVSVSESPAEVALDVIWREWES